MDELPAQMEPLASPALADSAQGEFTPLDARVIALWRLGSLIGFGVLWVAVLVAALGVGGLILEQFGFAVLAWLGFVAAGGFWIYWYPPLRYAAWGYRVDDRVLEIRQGVWFQTITLLPLSRLQHVDLHRGPIERARGLASIILHTAGTHQPAIVIPGLDARTASALRDRLVEAGGDDAV